MGLKLPRITWQPAKQELPFGVGGTCASTDIARRRFLEWLGVLGELAELQTAVTRLARELRSTQRRCNALSKRFIPDYRETIRYLGAVLEERERESLVILKMIRERMTRTSSPSAAR